MFPIAVPSVVDSTLLAGELVVVAEMSHRDVRSGPHACADGSEETPPKINVAKRNRDFLNSPCPWPERASCIVLARPFAFTLPFPRSEGAGVRNG